MERTLKIALIYSTKKSAKDATLDNLTGNSVERGNITGNVDDSEAIRKAKL